VIAEDHLAMCKEYMSSWSQNALSIAQSLELMLRTLGCAPCLGMCQPGKAATTSCSSSSSATGQQSCSCSGVVWGTVFPVGECVMSLCRVVDSTTVGALVTVAAARGPGGAEEQPQAPCNLPLP
jgi:hypothetical protein